MLSNAELLAQVPLFAPLSPEELTRLAAFLLRRRFARGDTIFHEGDPGTALYVVEEGEIKIVIGSSEGKEVILALLGRGDIFGELGVLDGEPRSADAVAKEAAQLVILRRADFLRFLADQHQVATRLLAVLSRRLRRTDQLIHDAAFLDIRTRLVRVLLELARTQGRPGPGGIALSSRFTQTDLANLVGATRESINKWLRFYGQKGLVRSNRGRLTLVDPERLRRDLL